MEVENSRNYKKIDKLKALREELERNIKILKNKIKSKGKEENEKLLRSKLNNEIRKYEEIQYLIIIEESEK